MLAAAASFSCSTQSKHGSHVLVLDRLYYELLTILIDCICNDVQYCANVSWQSPEIRTLRLYPRSSKALSIEARVECIKFQEKETKTFSRD